MAKTERTPDNYKDIILNEKPKDEPAAIADLDDLGTMDVAQVMRLNLVFAIRREARELGVPPQIIDKQGTTSLDLVKAMMNMSNKPTTRRHKYADGTLHDERNPRPKNHIPPDPRTKKRQQK